MQTSALALLLQASTVASHLCILLQWPRGARRHSSRLIGTAFRTWAKGYRNRTFLAPIVSRKLGRGGTWITSLRHGAARLPEECSWLMIVHADTYVNVGYLEQRLRCIERQPKVEYLGVPKLAAFGGPGDTFEYAQAEAGIVLRGTLVSRLGDLLDSCSLNVSLATNRGMDFWLGGCLWGSYVEFHHWLQDREEVFLTLPEDALHGNHQRMEMPPRRGPLARALERHTDAGAHHCIHVVCGLSAPEIVHMHGLAQIGARLFRNMGCVPGGLMGKELEMMQFGKFMHKSVFSQEVRRAEQECFPANALEDLKPETDIHTHEDLVEEWMRPQSAEGPVVERLNKGGHFLCVFVPGSANTPAYAANAQAVLDSWASPGPEQLMPIGTEAFLVGRKLSPGSDSVLRLRGDADLGIVHTGVRILYHWRYISAHHAENCSWFAKADADTFVNLPALVIRLRKYFNASEIHYLGALDAAALREPLANHEQLSESQEMLSAVVESGGLAFAHGALEIMSHGLVRRMGPWLETCLQHLIDENLGRGSADIDLAYCLRNHSVVPATLGAPQELLLKELRWTLGAKHALKNIAAGKVSQLADEDTALLGASEACTLAIHPLTVRPLAKVYQYLKKLRGGSLEELECPWPEVNEWPVLVPWPWDAL